MSSGAPAKKVINVERRTWDLDAYEKKAREREKQAETGRSGSRASRNPGASSFNSTGEEKEEFKRAAKGALGPERSERAFLKARSERVDVDSKIGSVEIVNPDAASTTKSVVQNTGSITVGL